MLGILASNSQLYTQTQFFLMLDFVRVYDNAVTPAQCAQLRQAVDDVNAKGFDADWRRCNSVSVGPSHPVFPALLETLKQVFRRYRNELQEPTLAFVHSLEFPYVHKYLTREHDENHAMHSFHRHSDNWSLQTATRMVSLVMYLNTVEEGGETVFTETNTKVKPQEGRVLLFPSHWTYPHLAAEPLSNDKYVVVSWFHMDTTGHKVATIPM